MSKFESNLSAVIEELQNKDVSLDAKDIDLEKQINNEVTARTNADTQLQTNIDSEVNARAVADKSLQDQITQEGTARTEGDKTLQTNIDSEAYARGVIDKSLQEQITQESTARTAADKELQDQINTLKAGSFSIADNGWYKLPGGLILQWGHAPLPTGQSIESANFTFPVPFPNKCLSFATSYDKPPQNSWGPMSTGIWNFTAKGGQLVGDAIGKNITNIVNVYYIAIGY
jgi:hypothetical protein